MLINVPWVMCNMLQCTGLLVRAKPDPCEPGAMGAGFLAVLAPGIGGRVCVGEKEGLVAPPCSNMTHPDFPQSSAIWLRYSMLDVQHTLNFFSPGNSSLNH